MTITKIDVSNNIERIEIYSIGHETIKWNKKWWFLPEEKSLLILSIIAIKYSIFDIMLVGGFRKISYTIQNLRWDN